MLKLTLIYRIKVRVYFQKFPHKEEENVVKLPYYSSFLEKIIEDEEKHRGILVQIKDLIGRVRC